LLSNLKKNIRKSNQELFLMEAVAQSSGDDDIRDAILDDTGLIDDDESTEIKKLVDGIPEFDEEQDMEEKLKHIKENFIPDTNY